MKVIIAGSRSVNSYEAVKKAVKDSGFPISEVISGTAMGIDQLGEAWALGHKISVKKFPADWNKYGRSAGFKRNEQMVEYADALIAVWDGRSKGTLHTIRLAEKAKIPLFVLDLSDPTECGHKVSVNVDCSKCDQD